MKNELVVLKKGEPVASTVDLAKGFLVSHKSVLAVPVQLQAPRQNLLLEATP